MIAHGYDVTLIYIGIASPALSEARVEQRTRHGGHDVPRDKLAPRFERSLANLEAALAIVPDIKVYDNSSPEDPYRLVATLRHGDIAQQMPGALPAWIEPILRGRRRPPGSSR